MNQNQPAKQRKQQAAKLVREGKSREEIAKALDVTIGWVHQFCNLASHTTEYLCRCCPSGVVIFTELDDRGECDTCEQSYDRWFFVESDNRRKGMNAAKDSKPMKFTRTGRLTESELTGLYSRDEPGS